MKKLSETVALMTSENYDDRLKAEYYQLKIRTDGLHNMLLKYKNNELSFVPKCSYDMLYGQYKVMIVYLSYLEDRASVEGIKLD